MIELGWSGGFKMSIQRVRPKLKQRILIADQDIIFARRLADYLWDHGYEARAVQTVIEARGFLRDWRPQTMFLSINFNDSGAMSLMRFVNSDVVRVKPLVTIMSKQNLPTPFEELRREGAKLSLLKPFPLEAVIRIIESTAQQPVMAEPTVLHVANPVRELHMLNLILKQAMQGEGQGRMFNLLRMINMKANAIRSTLFECAEPGKTAAIVASNDDENIGGKTVLLAKYPEIQRVLTTKRPLIIPNVRTSDILAPVQDKLAGTPFETFMLFPVTRLGKFYGVLSLRMEQKDPVQMSYIEKFGQVCAQILALSITHPEQTALSE